MQHNYFLEVSELSKFFSKFKCGFIKFVKLNFFFSLHMDPQFEGVQISEIYGWKSRLIYNGVDDLRRIEGTYLGWPKFTQDQILQLQSKNGEIRLRLEKLPENLRKKEIVEKIEACDAFKINYTMSL